MDVFRAFPNQMEVRSFSERVMAGIVVPFGLDRRIDDYLTERFTPVTFRHQYKAANRVRLYNQHSNAPGGQHIGQGILLRDDPKGLYGEFRVADSEIGRHYLAMAREGMLKQWSIGFRPEKSVRDGDVTIYTRAELFETALVPEGAYGELAQVASVRKDPPMLVRDRLLASLPPRL